MSGQGFRAAVLHRSPYFDTIRLTLTELQRSEVDPALVEAWMRNTHKTLDHLTPIRWRRAVRDAVFMVDASPRLSHDLALTYGFRPREAVA